MKARGILLLASLLLLGPSSGTSQIQIRNTTYEAQIKDAGRKLPCKAQDTCIPLARNIVEIEKNIPSFLEVARNAESAYRSFIQTAEDQLSNHQAGSPAGAAGSSVGLVSKAFVPQVIGLAEEGGALTQSSSGTTTTVTGNAYGLYRYLFKNGDVFHYCPPQEKCDAGWGWSRRLTGSVSLDNTSSSANSAPTSGTTANPSAATSSTTLSGANWRTSSWGVQFLLPGSKNIESSAAFRTAWNNSIDSLIRKAKNDKAGTAAADTTHSASPSCDSVTSAMAQQAKALDTALYKALGAFEDSDKYKNWLTGEAGKPGAIRQMATFLGSSSAPTRSQIEQQTAILLEDLVKLFYSSNPDADALNSAIQQMTTFLSARQSVADCVEQTLPGFSFAYTNSHPLNEANVQNFKLIYQMMLPRKSLSITANASADIYDALPAMTTVGRWRDLQTSAEADYTLKSGPVLSAAFYFQYMATKGVLSIPAGNMAPGTNIALSGPAATLLAPQGNIYIGQLLMTIPINQSGAKLPVGVSYSNRTDILPGPVWRAHIGLNFDFDSLLMGAKDK